jgi:predicted 3-demethylubiquinone-9 3-methyltransferase (glyoxalase superfamily)
MQKITPFLWFDREAEEAMSFYVSVFKNSKAGRVSRYAKGSPYPEGSVMSTTFNLEGLDFIALNGGPVFRFTQAISFFVSCETASGVDALWRKLSEGGKIHMALQKYPFSEKFGWVEDRFGISWQLNLAGEATGIAPFLLFVGDQAGKAEEAIEFYTSLLKNSGIERIERYGAGRGEKEGTVMHARFSLENQEFMAMDSGRPHGFTFTPAISFFVDCQTQEEVDTLWGRLCEKGKPGQCGWLTDQFGVSWQIVPRVLNELLGDADPAKAGRVMQAMLGMTKIDIEGLKRAYAG